MKKIRSKIKDQKGSITLLALTTMLMFTTIVVVVYVNINYKAQEQDKQIEKIQQSYQKRLLCANWPIWWM